MQLTLPPLSAPEMKLALDILTFDQDVRWHGDRKLDASAVRSMMDRAKTLDNRARVYAQRSAEAAKIKKQIWRYYFEESGDDAVRMDGIFRQWKKASQILGGNVTQKVGWFPLPRLALPTKQTIPLITEPHDLVTWFSVRLIANRQVRFFVRCKLCGRFAIRNRSSAKYCGSQCQNLAKVESIYRRRKDADFSAWLLRQPPERWLPPRMEMLRAVTMKKNTH